MHAPFSVAVVRDRPASPCRLFLSLSRFVRLCDQHTLYYCITEIHGVAIPPFFPVVLLLSLTAHVAIVISVVLSK